MKPKLGKFQFKVTVFCVVAWVSDVWRAQKDFLYFRLCVRHMFYM
jgi:hypothetical protein